MTTRDYQRAAHELRMLRTDMLYQHAMRPTARWAVKQRLKVYICVLQVLLFHQSLGVPYTTTYDVLRQNRAIILN